MEKRINKKIIIAISLATIMVMVGFTGLMYYNTETNTNNKINIPKLGYYINQYDFKDVHSMNKIISFNNPDVANNTSNNTIKMSYTFYNGTDNVTGTLLKIYKNGKLLHESLLINSTTSKEHNCTVVPLYSKTNNYKIIEATNTTNATPSLNTNDVCVDLYGTYYRGSDGRASAFNQVMTEALITLMTDGATDGGLLFPLFGVVMLFGIGFIQFVDYAGGSHGMYFYFHYEWWGGYPWLNAPANSVPWDFQNYGSATFTFYRGCL